MVTVRTLSGDEFSPDLPGRLLKIAGDIRAAGGRAFLVGGWVRDAMLGKSCRDYDIEVYDMAQDALVPLLSKYGRTNLVGKAFGVIHLAMKGLSLDFSFPRTENKVGYGHRGFVVHTDEKLSFKEAALRRDFTINAMGMELPELTLCDPYGGVDDLKAHRLKHVSEAFAEDSLRILRGVQFASRFELTLAPETAELCKSLSLEDLSKERIYEEFKKWLLKPGKPSLGLRAFLEMDLLRFFPERSVTAVSFISYGNRSLDPGPGIIAFQNKVFVFVVKNRIWFSGKTESGEITRGSGKLQLHLFKMIKVNMNISAGPDKFSRLKIAL